MKVTIKRNKNSLGWGMFQQEVNITITNVTELTLIDFALQAYLETISRWTGTEEHQAMIKNMITALKEV